MDNTDYEFVFPSIDDIEFDDLYCSDSESVSEQNFVGYDLVISD